MDSAQESPLKFPCDFPIKAMGAAADDLEAHVKALVRRHAPDLDDASVRTRPSRNGNYLSVTVTVRATSRDQLDAIYRELSGNDRIIMVL